MSMMVSFVLSFFPRDVLEEILNLIESVSEDFPSYSSNEYGITYRAFQHFSLSKISVRSTQTILSSTRDSFTLSLLAAVTMLRPL